MKQYISTSYSETLGYGLRLGTALQGGELIILTGQLGSGKTVLTKGIAQGLGINEVVTSPSFAIMNIYNGNPNLCHFDFYRLDDTAEMENLLEDYLHRDDTVSVIEWGEPLMKILDRYIHVEIELDGDKRVLSFEEREGTLLDSYKIESE